jgi:hypothetical protein
MSSLPPTNPRVLVNRILRPQGYEVPDTVMVERRLEPHKLKPSKKIINYTFTFTDRANKVTRLTWWEKFLRPSGQELIASTLPYLYSMRIIDNLK